MSDELSGIVEQYGFTHFGCSVYYNESEDEDTHAFNCTTEANAQWAVAKIDAAITGACEEATKELVKEIQQLRRQLDVALGELEQRFKEGNQTCIKSKG
jgi:hypothetical protein